MHIFYSYWNEVAASIDFRLLLRWTRRADTWILEIMLVLPNFMKLCDSHATRWLFFSFHEHEPHISDARNTHIDSASFKRKIGDWMHKQNYDGSFRTSESIIFLLKEYIVLFLIGRPTDFCKKEPSSFQSVWVPGFQKASNSTDTYMHFSS